MKKLLSIILSLTLTLPVGTISVSATAHDLERDSSESLSQVNSYQCEVGTKYNIILQSDRSTRTMTVIDSELKTIDVVSIDDETGVVTINGEAVTPLSLTSRTLVGTYAADNWTDPVEEVISLSLVGYTTGAIVGFLSLKFGVPSEKATYIAGLVIGAGGMLYVKSIRQYNYIDYAPKVGYIVTESLHITPEAEGESLFTRTLRGSR